MRVGLDDEQCALYTACIARRFKSGCSLEQMLADHV